MVEHTPPEELLFDYAAGTLPEPLALFIASHLTYAPESRRYVSQYEAIGGALMDQLEPEQVSDASLDAVMARLDEPETSAGNRIAGVPGDAASASNCGRAIPDGGLPEVLRNYLGSSNLESLPWKERGSQVSECRLLQDYPGFKTRLLRIRAGARVPSHTHDGREYTLVLKGGFSDAQGHYERGDVSVADSDVTHQPVADADEDCICLAVTDAPLKMTGPVGRFLNFFVDM